MPQRRLLTLAWLGVPVLALGQVPVESAPSRLALRQELDALEKTLADPEATPHLREERLVAFLAARRDHPELRPDERRVLQVRLAVLELSNRKPRAALARFESTLAETPPAAVDLRARCLLGTAQALEMLGQLPESTRRYEQVTTQFPGTSYARVARLARDRRPVRRGQPLAGARPVRTIDDRQMSLPRPGRRLLLFVPAAAASASDAALLAAVERRLPSDLSLCLVAPGPKQADHWRDQLAKRGLAAERLFVAADPDLADDLKLTVLPFWVLLDAEGRVVETHPDLAKLQGS